MAINPSVLYVEDDLQNRMVMDILLREEMKLTAVHIMEDSENFAERIEALPFQPDIVLLDIHVQPMNGFDMLRYLRQQKAFHDLPIIAITASVMNEEVEQLRRAGFDGAIAKPVQLESFPALLEQILQGKKIWRII